VCRFEQPTVPFVSTLSTVVGFARDTIYVQEVFMKVPTVLFSAALCLPFSASFASTAEVLPPFTGLAQIEGTSNPNALDIQDRYRDRERDRAHDDVRARLGDPSREPHRDQGFTAPSTDYKPDVPDASPLPRRDR
jgi:hypothetical protein